jgi:hypothetical protein
VCGQWLVPGTLLHECLCAVCVCVRVSLSPPLNGHIFRLGPVHQQSGCVCVGLAVAQMQSGRHPPVYRECVCVCVPRVQWPCPSVTESRIGDDVSLNSIRENYRRFSSIQLCPTYFNFKFYTCTCCFNFKHTLSEQPSVKITIIHISHFATNSQLLS